MADDDFTRKRIQFSFEESLYDSNQDWWSLWAWYSFLSDKLRLHGLYHSPMTPEEVPDEWVYAVATMLSNVKSVVMDSMNPPLQYNHVLLAWPDFEADTGHIYKGRFSLACHLAGLKELPRSNVASFYALQSKLVDENLPAMLVISYNAASLGITLNWNDPDTFAFPEQLVESTQHGAESALLDIDPARYWEEVKVLLKRVIGAGPLECLLLLGSHASDPSLLQAIKDVIERRQGSGPSIPQCGIPSRSQGTEDEDNPVFAVARRASEVAKVGMETGFFRCMEPDAVTMSNEQVQDRRHSEL